MTMTLEALQTMIDASLRARGGLKVPALDVLAVLVHQSVLSLAEQAVVLRLKVTDYANNNILRTIEPGVYLRVPVQALNATDEIDLDDSLIHALAFDVAASLARDVASYKIYKEISNQHLANHHFKIYETEEELTL
ncbi:hypothetical protein WCX49_11735 [Sulfurimonas sp. HSL-1656]|uniref:hypothetical protein n=1 Tax=Thiomicrolovo subterrani TaxID=3131934 RepID=UPI0031F75439